MVLRHVVIRGVADIGDVVHPADPGFGRPGGGWSPVDPGYDRPAAAIPIKASPATATPIRICLAGARVPIRVFPATATPIRAFPATATQIKVCLATATPIRAFPATATPIRAFPATAIPIRVCLAMVTLIRVCPACQFIPTRDRSFQPLPGSPIPVPRVPVVQVIPLPEGAVLPTEPPHRPGRIAIVVDGETKAVGWLQGSDDLPVPRRRTKRRFLAATGWRSKSIRRRSRKSAATAAMASARLALHGCLK